MPVYDLTCDKCEILFENAIMSYDQMVEACCPECGEHLRNIPARCGFRVKDSIRTRRQVMERRFKKREERIEREFSPSQKERLERFCNKYSCRTRY